MINSTVAAISTPRGKGGVSMIRISGDKAFEIASKVFFPRSGRSFSEYKPNNVVYGSFVSDGEAFDDGMAVFYKSPHSYTGEDTAEFCCHGGVLVTQKLLTAVISAGAVQAGPGDFTRRAFINGKLSLTGAEAVGKLIDATSEAGLKVSLLQMEGALSKKTSEIYSDLSLLAASVYAYIDYPDEDMTDVSVDEMKERLNNVYSELDKLYRGRKYGKAISDGIPTVIVGRPNTGKSSLLNLLSGEDRAIVTSTAGTTRDVITEKITLGNIVLDLSDTAGIRDSNDEIEKMGIQRSENALKNAEAVIFMVENKMTPEDFEVTNMIKKHGKQNVTVVLYNKADTGETLFSGEFENEIPFSAKTGEGKEKLIEILGEICGENEYDDLSTVITSSRQFGAISKARECVKNAISSLDSFTQDIAGMDIEEAMKALSELDGRQITEDIVNGIFSHFCVGK